MAKKDRFPPGYSAGFAPRNESEGSGCSGRIDTIEYPSGPTRKWVDLNSASKDGFSVPIQVIPVSKLSKFERKSLVLRLTSELDQVRLLKNKVESQKIKSVNAAITKTATRDILNFNAQHKGIGKQAKKPYGGQGSGPGKKGSDFNRSISGRFKSSLARVNANNVGLLKQCEGLLKKLMTQQYAWVFNKPVDVVELNIPDYFNVIKTPMDLGTIKTKITSEKYSCPLDFLADVRLTFTNAKTYNPPGTDVHIMADAMSQFFELRWKAIEKKLVISTTQLLPENSGVVDEIEIIKPLSPFKKRKLSPRRNEVVMQEPIKRKMTDEEKLKISSELESFIGDLPDSVIDFLRAQTTKGDGEEDEIEIDIDELSDDTLFALRKLLDDHLPGKHKSPTKSEACEIELPNVSGLSNSSLHVDKGNDPIDDDDVDIGGNETPVTSCHPILIDKDTGGRAEECNEAGPESDGGSECSKGSSGKQIQDDNGQTAESDKMDAVDDLVGHSSVSEMDQLEQGLQLKLSSSDSNGQLDGESTPNERPVSPDKLYRAALLKNRFADTILKAREKTLTQDDKADPERLRREKEEQKREKARLQAEAKVAEDARRRAEAEAAAVAKKRRELEREAAREALLKMEKTVEINENSRFLQDLEMLSSTVLPEQLVPSSVGEASPEHSQDGFGSFKFEGGNALEQLGLYMKVDDEDEEAEPPIIPNASKDAEEGEID